MGNKRNNPVSQAGRAYTKGRVRNDSVESYDGNPWIRPEDTEVLLANLPPYVGSGPQPTYILSVSTRTPGYRTGRRRPEFTSEDSSQEDGFARAARLQRLHLRRQAEGKE